MPVTVQQLEDITSRIKPYKGTLANLYHGTSNEAADAILREGYIPGSLLPEDAYRGGGYGIKQASTSFATEPKPAATFATALNPQGTILEAKLDPRANIVTIDGIEYAEDLNDYVQALLRYRLYTRHQYHAYAELVSLNPEMVRNTGRRAKIRGVDIKNTDFSQLFG